MARWNSCNVLYVGADTRHVWQFDGSSFGLNREQAGPVGEPLPPGMVAKSWSSLWQKKLNIAWLPPEDVFVRVAQFPQSSQEETRAMVELQLEKLSPIPVTQAVWSMYALPHASGNMQTVLLVFVSRNAVEEFLGRLEGQGYLADRLELPLLDQLQAASPKEDGAWIYPETQGGRDSALVAWWSNGVLQSVNLLTLSADQNRVASLKDQLTQMAWAGELEGWLSSPPRWHIVGNPPAITNWVTLLQEALEQTIEVVPPLSEQELAARTARRAADADPRSTLLPEEFVSRYHRQFVDRLWIRGLIAIGGLYAVCMIIFFAALGVVNYKTRAVETQVAAQGPAYTNSLQLAAQYKVLKERQELKFAALDCWEAVAETLPTMLTLESMNLSGGKKLSINGTAPGDQVGSVIDFSDKLRKFLIHGQPLFKPNNEPPRTSVMGGTVVRWSYDLELKRTGE
jgi:hypothetical protein